MQLDVNQNLLIYFVTPAIRKRHWFIHLDDERQNKAEFPVGVNKITARPTLLAWPQDLNFFRNFYFSFNPLVPEIKIQIFLTCPLRFLY